MPGPDSRQAFPASEKVAPNDGVGPVEYAGRLIAKDRRGWRRARELAGLGADVTPHVLKPTCITWLLQNRVPIWDVAGFVGTSEKVMRDTYGHHAPDPSERRENGFSGRNSGNAKMKGEIIVTKYLIGMVGTTGIEPVTPTMSR